MRICGGDVIQYEKIRKGSVRDYLTKISNFVESLDNAP